MSPDRTPEERERARLEREARRAAREGRPPPAVPPQPEPPRKPAPLRRSEQPAAQPPQEPQPPRQTPQPPRKPPPFRRPPGNGGDATPPPASAAEARRAAADRFLQRRRDQLSGGRGHRSRIVAIAGVVAMLVMAWFLISLFQPFKGDGEGRVRVVIPKGAGVSEVGDLLAERDVVSSEFFFKLRARLSGRGDELKAGSFTLKEGMSHSAAIDAIAEAPPPDVVRITIPEGRARREVAPFVNRSLRGDYIAATRRSSLLAPRAYGAKGERDLEGFLFPATYDIKRGRTVTDLVRQQLDTFEREFGKVDLRASRRRNLTPYDVLTVASMVEREARVARERPIIASVIYNRLREGLPLGIDATVRFATNNWSRPLRRSELESNSPYNTRRRRGLPPGPIGNPGLASIRAAADPDSTRFLYFVVKPGTCGEHAFSRTDAEFQRDQARYNAARARRGGKSPTRC